MHYLSRVSSVRYFTLAPGAVSWVYCHGGLGMLVYSDGALQCGNGEGLGQIELLFTLITSIWLLNERVSRREVLGMVLLVLGILMLF